MTEKIKIDNTALADWLDDGDDWLDVRNNMDNKALKRCAAALREADALLPYVQHLPVCEINWNPVGGMSDYYDCTCGLSEALNDKPDI